VGTATAIREDTRQAAGVGELTMTIVLGDNQTIFLDALSTVLTQRGYAVLALARSLDEFLAELHHRKPDACLVDCDLSGAGGPAAAATIRRAVEASPQTSVVVLGADPDPRAADLAMDAGAAGYLHQSRGVDALESALARAADGERVVDIPDARPASKPHRMTDADRLAAALTGREQECLGLLVAGLDTPAMVARMGVSRTTVRTHLQAVLTKLGVHSRLEAASFAVRHNLVEAWTEPTAALASTTAPARERPVALASNAA